ncbi:hypothetical protein Bca4012_065188 [Brassica carinata]
MACRLSHTEKGKWIPNSQQPPKKAPIRLPAVNCNNLIQEHKLTLIGRVTNPAIQKPRALVDFFLQHWQDLQAILTQAPYHFKRWMFILQRWEPIVSDLFPAKISFWITIHGLPLHYWTEEALEAIGLGLGHVEKTDADNGRVRVQLNGLQPLEKYLEISLDSGETKEVELEYEDLDKHCFSCRSLSHEAKDCPLQARSNNTSSDQNMGISQRRTLERIEENRRRADNRKRARFNPYAENRGQRRSDHHDHHDHHAHRSQDDRSLQGRQNYDHQNYRGSGRYDNSSERSYSNRSISTSADKDTHREKDNARSREFQERLTPIREISDGSLRSRGTKPANPVSRNIWRPVSGQHGNGNHSTSLQSQVSHTPSPKPQREAISSPASNPLSDRRGSGGQLQSPPTRRSALERLSEVEATAPTGERLSAFERISSPPTRVPLLLNGIANSDSGRLQEVNIQYLEEMFPYNTPEALSNPSRPSSSIPPPSDVHIDAGMLERSPIRTLSEDRAHVSLRLGPLSDSELTDSPPMTLKSAGKRKVTKPARAPSTRKTPRSPAQGISLNKRHIAKAQSSPKSKTAPNQAAKRKGKAKATGQPSAVLIPGIKKKKGDFRAAPDTLP